MRITPRSVPGPVERGARKRGGGHLTGGTAVDKASQGLAPRPGSLSRTPETLISAISSIAIERETENAVGVLYSTHYQSLVRLALLIVRDAATAEEVVQDAFVAMHGGWRRLCDTDKALSYLRQSVVNRSRSVLRHRAVVGKHAQEPLPDAPSAEQGAIALLERSTVMGALRALPARQRQALVLRYYADLSEADIAKAMGISRGAVKSHTARGISALRTVLELEC